MADELDLYDFPADYVGRKTYVTVRGHSRSVPKYKTYVGTDRRNYLLPDFGGDWSGIGNGSAYIMPDKLEYVSPIDGTHVTSRSTHRDHMRQHGVIEAGDMTVGSMGNRDRAPMTRVGHDIKRAMAELRSR